MLWQKLEAFLDVLHALPSEVLAVVPNVLERTDGVML